MKMTFIPNICWQRVLNETDFLILNEFRAELVHPMLLLQTSACTKGVIRKLCYLGSANL
jgi:hypothetical protein